MNQGSLFGAINGPGSVMALKTAVAKLGLPAGVRLCVERVHFSQRRPPVVVYRWDCASGRAGQLFGEFIGNSCADHARQESVRLRKRRRNQWADAADPVVAAPALGLVVRLPGVDARLPGLRLLREPGLAGQIACRALGIGASGVNARVRLRAHRLGKRAVLQVDLKRRARNQRVFFRLNAAASAAGERRFERHRQVCAALSNARQAAVLLPDALVYDKALSVAVYSDVAGRTASASHADEYELARAGRIVLDCLARADIAPDERYSPQKEIELLASWHDLLRQHLPELAPAYGLALARLQDRFVRLPAAQWGLCHRDLHDGQILHGADGIGLIDFDTACYSDRAIDAGNLLAHRRFLDLSEQRAGDGHRQRLYRMLEPDFSARQCDRIRFWEAVSLLRLAAIHAFRAESHGAFGLIIDEVNKN